MKETQGICPCSKFIAHYVLSLLDLLGSFLIILLDSSKELPW